MPWLSHRTTMIIRDPIYLQLNDELRELINRGDFEAGSKFMTEREVAEQFKISRTTANKALSALVAEGLLEFRKGVGTFVRSTLMDYDLRSLVSFTEKAVSAGYTPSTKVLHFLTVEHNNACKAAREVISGDMFELSRLRFAGNTPVILEKRWISKELSPDLTAITAENSLYAIWTDKYNLQISGADEVIRAVNIIGDDAWLLQINEGTAGLLVTATGHITNGGALWYEETLYRGDTYQFRMTLGKTDNLTISCGMLDSDALKNKGDK